MKRAMALTGLCLFSAGIAHAGGYSDPVVAPQVVIEPQVVIDETAGSSAGGAELIVLLTALIIFGAALSN